LQNITDKAEKTKYDLILNCHRRTVSLAERRAKLQEFLKLRPDLKTPQQVADELAIPLKTIYKWFPQEMKKKTRPSGKKILSGESSQQTTLTTTPSHACICKDLSENHWDVLTRYSEKTSKTAKEALQIAVELLAMRLLTKEDAS
jgi:hypothetical protein